MGGAIGVTSTPGAGSTFHMTLPLAAEAAAADEAAEGASIAGLSVMVVDDNPINRELSRRILEALEAQVTTADGAAEALSLLAARPVDVVLMDLRMPGVDGREALVALRAADGPNRATPVLAFTADAEVGDGAGLEGFDGVVRKPIDATELTAKLAAAVAPDRSDDGARRATA